MKWKKKRNENLCGLRTSGGARARACYEMKIKQIIYLHFFAVYFHGSNRKIHTDCRSLRRSEESFCKSFNQASFSNVGIADQDDFKEVTIVIHFVCEAFVKSDTSGIYELYKLCSSFCSKHKTDRKCTEVLTGENHFLKRKFFCQI